MYYAYSYKKSSSEIYGICIVCGEICINLKWLYDILKKSLEASAYKGVLFCYDENGKIRKNVDTFSLQAIEVDNLFSELEKELNKKKNFWSTLPAEDFSTPLNSKICFSFNEDDNGKITDAIKNYHNVYVTLENESPSSYAKIVERLNSEKIKLQEQNKTLEEKIIALSRQKKQFRNVIILCFIVLGCGIALFFVNSSLNQTQKELDNANHTIAHNEQIISIQTVRIDEMSSQIDGLKESLSTEKNRRIDAENHLVQFKDSISPVLPILITDIQVANIYSDGSIQTNYVGTLYSSSSMFLKPRITYTGIRNGESITLYARLYGTDGKMRNGDSSPYGYTFSSSMIINSGDGNTHELSGWGYTTKGLYPAGTYRYEIWYSNKCLGSKTFTLY